MAYCYRVPATCTNLSNYKYSVCMVYFSPWIPMCLETTLLQTVCQSISMTYSDQMVVHWTNHFLLGAQHSWDVGVLQIPLDKQTIRS